MGIWIGSGQKNFSLIGRADRRVSFCLFWLVEKMRFWADFGRKLAFACGKGEEIF